MSEPHPAEAARAEAAETLDAKESGGPAAEPAAGATITPLDAFFGVGAPSRTFCDSVGGVIQVDRCEGEYLPRMHLRTHYVPLTDEACDEVLDGLWRCLVASLACRVGFVALYDFRTLQRPSLAQVKRLIKWVSADTPEGNREKVIPQVVQLVVIILADSWMGKIIKGLVNMFIAAVKPEMPTRVVFTDEDANAFIDKQSAKLRAKEQAEAKPGSQPLATNSGTVGGTVQRSSKLNYLASKLPGRRPSGSSGQLQQAPDASDAAKSCYVRASSAASMASVQTVGTLHVERGSTLDSLDSADLRRQDGDLTPGPAARSSSPVEYLMTALSRVSVASPSSAGAQSPSLHPTSSPMKLDDDDWAGNPNNDRWCEESRPACCVCTYGM